MIRYSFVLLFSLFTATLYGQDFKSCMEAARRQRDTYNEPLALAKFKEALKFNGNDYEALWNASFLSSRVGNRQATDDEKMKFFEEAKEFARRAIEANPNDAEGHYVMAVALGRYALVAGTREKVACTHQIKTFAMTAIKFNNKHAGAWHVLGKWHFKVANLTFAEKAAMNLLFGGVPEGASNENAIKCYLYAIQYSPDYILYHRDLGEVYKHVGNTTSAKASLLKATSLKAVTPDDPGYQNECRTMLGEIGN